VLVLVIHAGLSALSYYAAFYLRLDDLRLRDVGHDFSENFGKTVGLAVVFRTLALQAFGLNRGLWRYAGMDDLLRLAYAIAASSLALFAVTWGLIQPSYVPRGVLVIDAALSLLLLGGVRFVKRALGEARRAPPGGPRAVVVGAGDTGEAVVRELKRLGRDVPVALVDDDPGKQGRSIHGVPVRGGIERLGAVVRETEATEVVLAVPPRASEAIQRAVAAAGGTGVRFRILARESGPVRIAALRNLDVADLLSRPVAALDEARIADDVRGRRVLVTGGAGSIGAELVRRALAYGPSALTVVDRDENGLHYLVDGLGGLPAARAVRVRVADVADRPSVARVFEEARPEYVIHAAAYKHVPLMEANPLAAVRNNVGATRTVLAEADRTGAAKFLLVSSDKAVRPSSVMGATKRAAERALVAPSAAASPAVRVAVRFGNVVGSAGSVVPLFARQIERGGPVTLTHRDATRYFMTIPEAVGLVLQAASMARGGEVFHLDMGRPVRIEDLARRMIELAGFVPGRDVEVEEIGLRPGEKLHEELLAEGETVRPTAHPQVRVATAPPGDAAAIARGLDALESVAASADLRATLSALCALVPEYRPANDDLKRLLGA
jgi:FlaA1/EpsC-like NDP-sugar epimerase